MKILYGKTTQYTMTYKSSSADAYEKDNLPVNIAY